MKIHGNRKCRLDLKHDYRKYARGIKRYAKKWFYVYCENTSLHGFRYIIANGSTIIESVVWFAACLASIAFCVTLMLRLWWNYSKNPIVTTIDTSKLIWSLPFPGVTICNSNKIYRPHADLITRQLQMNGISVNESDKFFSSLLKLIRPDKVSIDDATAKHVFDTLGMTVEMLMRKLMQPCSALLVRCAWVGQILDCNKIFKTVKSKEGFCCGFNFHYGLNTRTDFFDTDEDYDLPKEYNSTYTNFTSSHLPGVHHIINVPGSGRDVGLAVVLNVDRYNYKGSLRPSVGASVFIHDSIDFPDIGAQIAFVPPGHVLTVSVTGTSIKSMSSMRDLPLERRLCYFDDELSSDSHYSFQSCVSECIAKQLLHDCGCLPFYYPEKLIIYESQTLLCDNYDTKIFDVLTDDGVRTCYVTDVNCILSTRRKLSEKNVATETCNDCLPQCTDMMYSIDTETIKMDEMGYDSEITEGLDLHKVSLVYVYFGDVSYVEYRKESILSWDALLASFGGIFGLCLGGSVISVIELVYLTARELYKYRKTQGQSHKGLFPPASDMFLSIPAEKVQLRKLRNPQEFIDKPVHVAQYQSSFQRRRITNFEDVHCNRNKF